MQKGGGQGGEEKEVADDLLRNLFLLVFSIGGMMQVIAIAVVRKEVDINIERADNMRILLWQMAMVVIVIQPKQSIYLHDLIPMEIRYYRTTNDMITTIFLNLAWAIMGSWIGSRSYSNSSLCMHAASST